MLHRGSLVLIVCAVVGSTAAAQVNLAETPQAGDLARYQIELSVHGKLFVSQEGKPQEVALTAKAKHRFVEKTLAAADGMPARSIRLFDDATASALVGTDKDDHRLPADRKLFIAARTADGLFCFALAGAVTREELDLVSEHFDPHCLPGLLPGKAVKVGNTWAVGNAAAQAAGLFDSLIKNSLTGKLTDVKDGVATFAITGSMEGIENGAKVTLTIDAVGRFQVATGRIVALTWKQTDDREQGPASPASKLEAVVVLQREKLAEEPKELAAAPIGEPSARQTMLHFADSKGRYRFEYPRQWHITGQTDDHLVLRLLDRGEFVAQATITAWKKAEAGQHATVEEFKKAVSESPGWVPERVLEDAEVPLGGGRWLYRLSAEGKMAEQPAVQAFHMLAGPRGDQVAVTIAMKPEKVKALGARGLDLIKAIEFDAK
ncbi:MAG TPA: hypothetical protein VN641_11025 [Urbifossiella sp.]|nr:hypothetical protein [Urbifossiella sp.]